MQVAGKHLSRNLVFFDVTHDLQLPVAPGIESSLAKTERGYSLPLRTPALARNVSLGDLDVHVSDDYFDLLPGEPVTIAIETSSTLDQLKSALRITFLTEAFSPVLP